MKNLNLFFTCVFIILVLTGFSKKKETLIAKNASVQKAGDGFRFTEGPAVASDGRVYFTDQPNDRIHIWDEKKGISLYKEGTGRSNGLYFNKKGRLISCADEKNQIAYFDEKDNLVPIHEGFEGKHLNAPNDLWISPNSGLYFSDPYYNRSWWPAAH